MMAKVVDQDQRDWDEKLPFVVAAYRATVHEATKYTPNRLFLGRELRLPADMIYGVPPDPSSAPADVDEYVDKLEEDMSLAYQKARENLGTTAYVRKNKYDAGIKSSCFDAEDMVWYLYPRRYTGRSPKWQNNYTGPYKIVKNIDTHNVVLQATPRSRRFVVHKDKLKKYYGEVPQCWAKSNDNSVIASKVRPHCDETDVVPVSKGRNTITKRVERGPVELGSPCEAGRPKRDVKRPTHLNDYHCGLLWLSDDDVLDDVTERNEQKCDELDVLKRSTQVEEQLERQRLMPRQVKSSQMKQKEEAVTYAVSGEQHREASTRPWPRDIPAGPRSDRRTSRLQRWIQKYHSKR